MAGGVAQVVECLPNKHEALSSNPSTEKKKKVFSSLFGQGFVKHYMIFQKKQLDL
jgi:hypothetical protein